MTSSAFDTENKSAENTAGERWRCKECYQIWTVAQLEQVFDSKSDSGEFWNICPGCRAAENFDLICDVPTCKMAVSAGWPSPEGYRRTCSNHYFGAHPVAPATPPDKSDGSDIAEETNE